MAINRIEKGKTLVICAFCGSVIRYLSPAIKANRRVYGVCPNCSTAKREGVTTEDSRQVA